MDEKYVISGNKWNQKWKKRQNKNQIAIVKSTSTYSIKITGSDGNFSERIFTIEIYSFNVLVK